MIAPGNRQPRGRGTGGGRRGTGERGAAIIEFALVMPVLALFLMGIVDFGSAFNDFNSVRQGVREGARQVVVANWADPSCTQSTSAEKAICLTKKRIGLDSTKTFVKLRLDGAYESGDPVTVCAQYRMHSITGMFSGAFDQNALRSSITMRLEQVDDLAPITAYAETPPSGMDWSWC